MPPSIDHHPSSFFAIPESSTDGSSAYSRETKSIPRHSFLKMAKQRRFATMLEIFERSEEYDLDAWLFPSAATTSSAGSLSPVSGISSPLALLPKSPNYSRSTFRTHRKRSPQQDDDYKLDLFRGETPLHILLRYNPPEELVHRVIEYLSQSEQSCGVPEDSIDMLGRTPLHVACANGAAVAVVERLLNGESSVMPAFAKDATGRHALHGACANPQGSWRRQVRRTNHHPFVESMALVDNMVNVVKALLKAYPESVFIADHEGNRPKDLARMQNADERILLLLSREEHCCELDNQYQKNFSSVADTTVAETRTITLPRSRDDVSSIGSAGLSCYEEKPAQGVWTKELLKLSPFHAMTSSDEVIRFVERNLCRPPIENREEFGVLDNNE
ncbi:hypothetical protein FisN_12Lh117 [Fistulifera solaris]|uniref:Uncharacterized protein n=1 Tax=Fistulifera solaris TaxID=1519565 RepID=A0A1Z5JN13_FISSO|nr:hypothetical protein FisN_12Lh117 [Fistulifera solaris]|eukprot:GAX15181.1 hypothetical protein FisN_12Lh117 [Fistulifera solaris]